jgi:hypothetical protein
MTVDWIDGVNESVPRDLNASGKTENAISRLEWSLRNGGRILIELGQSEVYG